MNASTQSYRERTAGRRRRLSAFVLDVSLPFVVGLLAIFPLAFISESLAKIAGAIAIVALIVTQAIIIIRRSASIGKFLLNLQVVDEQDGRRIGFWHYMLLRELVGKTLVVGSMPILNLTFQPIYFVIDSLYIFRKDRRALHDLIAGTRVVMLAPEERRKSFTDWSRLPR